MAGSLGRDEAKIASRLQWHAYFVECDQVGRQSCYLIHDQRLARRPAFVVLFEVQRDHTERHSLSPPSAADLARCLAMPPCAYA
jgi:hypothetical protein